MRVLSAYKKHVSNELQVIRRRTACRLWPDWINMMTELKELKGRNIALERDLHQQGIAFKAAKMEANHFRGLARSVAPRWDEFLDGVDDAA